jgi:hypothetical protein
MPAQPYLSGGQGGGGPPVHVYANIVVTSFQAKLCTRNQSGPEVGRQNSRMFELAFGQAKKGTGTQPPFLWRPLAGGGYAPGSLSRSGVRAQVGSSGGGLESSEGEIDKSKRGGLV